MKCLETCNNCACARTPNPSTLNFQAIVYNLNQPKHLGSSNNGKKYSFIDFSFVFIRFPCKFLTQNSEWLYSQLVTPLDLIKFNQYCSHQLQPTVILHNVLEFDVNRFNTVNLVLTVSNRMNAATPGLTWTLLLFGVSHGLYDLVVVLIIQSPALN